MAAAKYVVCHNDLDGIVSAAIYTYLHKDVQVIGMYDFARIEYAGDWTLSKCRNNPEVLCLDLDICRSGYQSMGHHIVSPDNSIVMHNNPNYCYGVTDMTHKYPLSTALILTEQYRILWSREQMRHLWLIDGAVCNYYKYPANVCAWLRRMPHLASYGDPQTPDKRMVLDDFLRKKFALKDIPALNVWTQEVYGLGVASKLHSGEITSYPLIPVRASGLSNAQILEHLAHPRMLSHAITNVGKVSYTLLPDGMEG